MTESTQELTAGARVRTDSNFGDGTVVLVDETRHLAYVRLDNDLSGFWKIEKLEVLPAA